MLLLATLAKTSHAHDPFEVTTIARVGTDALVVEVTMARSTALGLVTGRHNPRATFAPEAFHDQRPALERVAPSLYELTSSGQALRARTVSARLTDDGDVEVVAAYERPPSARLFLRASHLFVLPEGYTSALSVVQTETQASRFKLLTRPDPGLEVHLGEIPDAENRASLAPEVTVWGQFERFVVLGVEHVVTGYDHLLFLFGVLIACRTVRSMLAVVTSFTLAHSLTLGLAVFSHVSISGRIVEPLIAASIVFVGIENVRRQDRIGRRVAVTFAFGLVHGLGFAGALEGLHLTGGAVPLTLFSFNLGVELGQLAVALLAVPVLSRLHTTPHGLRGLRFSSVALSLTGLFWFVQRVTA
jgi:hydrogenase/urease accessory protein HupE